MRRSDLAPFLLAIFVCHVATSAEAGPAPADAILATVMEPALHAFLEDVLARNPEVAVARARAAAAAQVGPQVRGLPDPMIGADLTTRPSEGFGASDLMLRFEQERPSRKRRRLEVAMADAEADGSRAAVESVRLQLLTEARVAWHELAGIDAENELRRQERETLREMSSLARARQSVGEASLADGLRFSAEVTRIESELVEIEARREEVRARLASLADRSTADPMAARQVDLAPRGTLDLGLLCGLATSGRPELAQADAMTEAARLREESARLGRRTEVTYGAWYEAMGVDASGPMDDPDEVGFMVRLRLPVHSARIAAAIEQAVQLRLVAGGERRAATLRVEREVREAAARLRRAERERQLVEQVLLVQAEEALKSTLAQYSAGGVEATAVLDAARVMFEAEGLMLRARTDTAVAVALLEAALASPLPEPAPASSEGGGQ